jgi:hypothetical protein
MDSESATRLSGIAFRNNTAQKQSIQLRLRRENGNERSDDEVVYEDTVSLDANERTVLDLDWPDGATVYTLLYSTAEELHMTRIPHDFDSIDESACNYIRVVFRESAGVSVSVTSETHGFDETPSC